MMIVILMLALAAAPTSTFDRLSNTTVWVAANKGLALLVPVGNELRVTTEGTGKSVVKQADIRFWATVSSDGGPNIGILAAPTGLNEGALLIDGTRVDSVGCLMPSVPTPMGRFTTWHRDLSLSAKGLRALATARKKIEIACGKRVETLEGGDLANFMAAAKLFVSADFPSDMAEQFKKDAEAERRERTERPAASTSSGAVGGELAALRARKMAQIAICIATEFEKNESANVDAVTKLCKGFIDSDGDLISAK